MTIIMSFVALGQLLLSVCMFPRSEKWHATVLILFLGLVSGLFSLHSGIIFNKYVVRTVLSSKWYSYLLFKNLTA